MENFHREYITVKGSNKAITNNEELPETIINNLEDSITNPNSTDPVFCAIKNYENHPSIFKIKEMMRKITIILL